MNAEIERRVRRFVEDLQRSPAGPDVLAVVVAGSAAREEERWDDGELRSDIDLMVVSRSSPLRLDRSRAVSRVIDAHAAANLDGGRIPVATLDYATLTNFEARHRGVVVAGEPGVLARIPLDGSADIPRWEAVRLLANRLFEHLKLRAGTTGPAGAVLKSYEAIGESQLVLERRYRPSFAERVAEIERQPLGSPVAGAGDAYLAAERFRHGDPDALSATPAQALDDLRLQLGHALEALDYSGATLDRRLAAVADDKFHFRQRLYWTLRGLGSRDGLHRPGSDPVVQLWRAAARALSAPPSPYDPAALVRLWQQCPQILEKGEPR